MTKDKAPKQIFWFGPLPVTVRTVPTAQGLLAPGRGANPHDVRQRGFASCHLLASAQAVLARDPNFIERTLVPCPEGFRVRTHADTGRTPHDVVIPAARHRFCALGISPMSWAAQDTQQDTPLWPTYLEDAYAATHGGYGTLTHGRDPKDTLQWLTGLPAKTIMFGYYADAESRLRMVAEAFLHGECVVVHTRGHAWAVLNATLDRMSARLTLINPKGSEEALLTAQSHVLIPVAFSQTVGFGAIGPSPLRKATTRFL